MGSVVAVGSPVVWSVADGLVGEGFVGDGPVGEGGSPSSGGSVVGGSTAGGSLQDLMKGIGMQGRLIAGKSGSGGNVTTIPVSVGQFHSMIGSHDSHGKITGIMVAKEEHEDQRNFRQAWLESNLLEL